MVPIDTNYRFYRNRSPFLLFNPYNEVPPLRIRESCNVFHEILAAIIVRLVELQLEIECRVFGFPGFQEPINLDRC